MQSKQTHNTFRIFVLRLLVLVLIATVYWAYTQLQTANELYDGADAITTSQPSIAGKASIGEVEFKIPTYNLFKSGELWELVSKKNPMRGEADYDLINIPVAHGDEKLQMMIASEISDELQQLVNAAEADGEPLMISSAFRSKQEQQELYDEFVAKNGEVLAAQYVSPPGSSEHHTGMSVDFASVSDDCAEDSDTCSLSQSGAIWLADNANRFGFIQRYPEGKQQTTGVAYEPWHFRFVGKSLSKAMSGTELTFDEVVLQIAPGYAKQR
ncbi:MAG: M15 family metallopeptidase [Candidatus Saccharimonadales bacterium]